MMYDKIIKRIPSVSEQNHTNPC